MHEEDAEVQGRADMAVGSPMPASLLSTHLTWLQPEPCDGLLGREQVASFPCSL